MQNTKIILEPLHQDEVSHLYGGFSECFSLSEVQEIFNNPTCTKNEKLCINLSRKKSKKPKEEKHSSQKPTLQDTLNLNKTNKRNEISNTICSNPKC
ncbi:MAG: hypothetical protein RMJ97_09145 [Raineya sp.]|nr:hypothetical protein [Raineya sp.]MDW8297031.1 hypothetical protein [Raineya sp.]